MIFNKLFYFTIMIKVKYIKNFQEDTEEIIDSKEFPNAIDQWDKEIGDYTYNKLLDLNSIYDFNDYDNAESITEVIYDDKDKIIALCDCIELYYNL